VRRRESNRKAARQQANAELCGLPLTEYLALSRRERKRQVGHALDAVAIPLEVVGTGPFCLAGERRRMARAVIEARKMLKEAHDA
jgi:hypothetical protein